MKIKYYLNFKEENRVSMDEFGEQLINYQSNNYKEHEISYFKPKLNFFVDGQNDGILQIGRVFSL